MEEMTLYTKNNCPACERVKDFIKASDKETLHNIKIVNVNEVANFEEVMAYMSKYSKTFPTLTGKDFFITNSYNIIELLKTIA